MYIFFTCIFKKKRLFLFWIDLLLKRFVSLICAASASRSWKERVNCFVAGWFGCHYCSHYVVTVTAQPVLGKSNNHQDYFYPSVTDKIEYGCGVFLRASAGAAAAADWDRTYFRPLLLTVKNRSGQNRTLLGGLQITSLFLHLRHPFSCSLVLISYIFLLERSSQCVWIWRRPVCK